MLFTPQSAGSLVIAAPGRTPRAVPLLSEVLLIGNSPECDVVLDDPEVLDRHAQIRLGDGEVLLYASRGARITLNDALPEGRGPWRLQPGVVYGFGSHRLTYQPGARIDGPKDPAPASPAAPAVTRSQGRPADAHVWPRLRTISPHDEPPPHVLSAQSRYLRYLPGIFQDQELPGVDYPSDQSRTFLGRYLQIFESLWELLEQRQEFLDLYFHPATCPDSFVGWLAGWFGIVVEAGLPEERRRRLAAEIYELYRWRGTRYGLQRLLTICTGAIPTIVDAVYAGEPGAPPPCVFRVQITLPAGSEISRTFVAALIETHKPAHAGYILELRT